MNRKNRLVAADKWLQVNNLRSVDNVKKVVKRYARWFGVDKLCAIAELRLLGYTVSEEYEAQVRRAIEDKSRARREAKEKRKAQESVLELVVDSNEHFAFIAGYTSAGFAYGITWEDWEKLDG